MSGTERSEVEQRSGNVFADLGRPDADLHLAKATLVVRIDSIVRRRRLTNAQAAELLGLPWPDVSRLLRGYFRDYSIVRLRRLLVSMDRSSEIGKTKT